MTLRRRFRGHSSRISIKIVNATVANDLPMIEFVSREESFRPVAGRGIEENDVWGSPVEYQLEIDGPIWSISPISEIEDLRSARRLSDRSRIGRADRVDKHFLNSPRGESCQSKVHDSFLDQFVGFDLQFLDQFIDVSFRIDD